ncbi:MAG: ABC transporter permease [Polyangia bacterium]|jgi:phospholipid/cholesterol/gamma-HCH transport system permease protein|nr:ABC transporter permease [Polyangia bacterium]
MSATVNTPAGTNGPPRFPLSIPYRVGGALLGMLDAAKELWRILGGTIRYSIWGKRPEGEVWNQMYQVGNKSLLFVCVTLGCLGMVLVFQVCLQINKVTGDLSMVGAEFIKGMVHAFAPTLTAMMLATRVGAGIAAEIGSMMVTEQVDALRMCGVEPIEYLIAPRFIAALFMTVVLTMIALLVSVLAGALMAYSAFDVNPAIFLQFDKVTTGDLIIGGTKALVFGATIPVVSGYCGLTTRGGSEGVGSATTRAVISSSLAVILWDFVISGLGYYFLQSRGL